MELKKLLNGLETTKKYEGQNFDISDISFDSRKVYSDGENGIFVCLKGENTDGHLFASDALNNGAKVIVTETPLNLTKNEIVVKSTRQALAVLSSNFYENAHKKLKLIAITGTNGKTTTTFMLKSILEASGKKVGLIGTTGAYIGKQFLSVNLTTPDPMDLHRLFKQMVDNACEYCIMEASAHSLFLDKLFGLKFEASIFSNFTQDHLDFFKTMDNYKQAKLKLFTKEYSKCCIVNVDDNVGMEILNGCDIACVGYALYSPADCFAIDIFKSYTGSKFVLNLLDDIFDAEINLPGEFNIYNALAAASTARILGVSATNIKLGLKNLKFVSGRFNSVKLINGAYAIIDFAHTPDGLLKVLSAIKELNPKKLITVFGCGGNRDKDKRHKMGEISDNCSDFSIITSDNPRFENPELILKDIEKGFKSDRYVTIVDRAKAVEIALSLSRKGDIVAILGKGGENYQDINGVKVPYSDYDNVVKFNEKMETIISVMGVE